MTPISITLVSRVAHYTVAGSVASSAIHVVNMGHVVMTWTMKCGDSPPSTSSFIAVWYLVQAFKI
jgi:hypothetical protein